MTSHQKKILRMGVRAGGGFTTENAAAECATNSAGVRPSLNGLADTYGYIKRQGNANGQPAENGVWFAPDPANPKAGKWQRLWALTRDGWIAAAELDDDEEGE